MYRRLDLVPYEVFLLSDFLAIACAVSGLCETGTRQSLDVKFTVSAEEAMYLLFLDHISLPYHGRTTVRCPCHPSNLVPLRSLWVYFRRYPSKNASMQQSILPSEVSLLGPLRCKSTPIAARICRFFHKHGLDPSAMSSLNLPVSRGTKSPKSFRCPFQAYQYWSCYRTYGLPTKVFQKMPNVSVAQSLTLK